MTTVVHKPLSATVAPNLEDYDAARASFDWADAERELLGATAGAGLNIARVAIDRHAAGERRDHVALRWLGRDGEREEYTYGDLAAAANRFANVLGSLGLPRGSRVFALMPRIPELYVAAPGPLKAGCVFCPTTVARSSASAILRATGGDADLREELDLDSMDALTLLEELAAAIGTDIPDRDAARLRTRDDLVAYVVASARQPTH